MVVMNSDVESLAREIEPQVRVVQIVHAALMASVAAFLGFQLFQGPTFAEDPMTLPVIPLGFAIGGAMLSFVMPMVVRQSALARLGANPPVTTAALMNTFQSGHIVGMAMLEGAGLMTGVALGGIFGSVPRGFVAVPAALLVLMAMRFPRAHSVAEWIAARREELSL